MEVILLERIEKLGQMGDLVTVKPGYARNYLLPNQKAMRATEANRQRFETERAQLEAENLDRRGEAEAVAAKMDTVSVIMVRQAGDTGQLYGSVNARDIAQAVTAEGFTVDRRQIALGHVIKTLGIHPAEVILHPEVTIAVRVNVARSEEEAKLQAQGIDVTATDLDDQDEEEARAEAEAMFEEGGDQVAEEASSEDAEPADGEANENAADNAKDDTKGA
ncbi:MAG: 50S ribosomal protein L9 [Alphaproteobacteria bacterium]